MRAPGAREEQEEGEEEQEDAPPPAAAAAEAAMERAPSIGVLGCRLASAARIGARVEGPGAGW
jgi:hypothetical protein